MTEIARSTVRTFSTACALALAATTAACSSATGTTGVPDATTAAAATRAQSAQPMTDLTQLPPPGMKHCCLVASELISGAWSVDLYRNAPPYASIGAAKPANGSEVPIAVALSHRGVLYVADLSTQEVYAYGHGYRRAPSATYPQSSPSGNAVPRSLAVGSDGTLYVANGIFQSNVLIGSFVQAYPPGGQPYTLQGPPNATDPPGVAVDAHDNVYIAANAQLPSDPSAQVVQVIEYAPGSPSGQVRNLNAPSNFARAIAVDPTGNVLIGDMDGSCSAVFIYPPGQSNPSKTIETACSLSVTVTGIALTSHHRLYFSNGAGLEINEFSYPSGKPVGTLFLGGASGIFNMAAGPAAAK